MTTTTQTTSFGTELFEGAVPYYVKYRPRYPQALYKLLVEEFGLNGSGNLLDLGCGIGLISIALHSFFAQVVGIDPSLEMLLAAKQEADQYPIANITWKQDIAENITPALGSFKLITIGRAFHWMQQNVVLEHSYELLEPHGGIAIIQTEQDIWTYPDSWAVNVLRVIKQTIGEKRRAGNLEVDSLYPDRGYQPVFDQSPFQNFRKREVILEQHWTVDSLIGHLYSTAYCRKEYLNGSTTQFEAEIEKAILAAEPSGKFIERLPISVYLATKSNL